MTWGIEVDEALQVWRSIFWSVFSAAYYVLSILSHLEHYVLIKLGIVIDRETPPSSAWVWHRIWLWYFWSWSLGVGNTKLPPWSELFDSVDYSFIEGNFWFLKFELVKVTGYGFGLFINIFSSHFLGSLSIGDIARGQEGVSSKGAIWCTRNLLEIAASVSFSGKQASSEYWDVTIIVFGRILIIPPFTSALNE